MAASSPALQLPDAPGSAPRRRFTLDEVPPELHDNFLVQALLNMTREQEENADLSAEAAELYGDDTERELADIKAGRHPLQRDGAGLDAYEKVEASLAAHRAAPTPQATAG